MRNQQGRTRATSDSRGLEHAIKSADFEIRAIHEAEPRVASHLEQVRPDYIRPIVEADNVIPQAGVDLAIDSDGNVLRLYAFDVDAGDFFSSLDLTRVEFVSLYGGSYSSLDFLAEAFNLQALYLGGSLEIDSIPAELTDLDSLLSLVVEEVTGLTTPPPEIARQGLQAIRNYTRSVVNSTDLDFLHEAKMVIVGRGFVGKTTLMRKLMDPTYQLERHLRSTEGIEIAEWSIPHSDSSTGKFNFNIWDFAGQEKYDATHQFFLTERTLYLFVTEARQESNFLDFDYWLTTLSILARNSPVIVVQNKIDERRKKLPTDYYQRQFPFITDFVDVSCADGYEDTLEQLKKAISTAIDLLPQVEQELPKTWVDIRRRLESLDSDHIPYGEYEAICGAYGLNLDQAEYLCRYLHDLGVVVRHQGDLLLRQTVIVKPDWAVDGAYEVLDTPMIEHNNGRFNASDLDEIWADERYKARAPELLALMMSYGLCFELGDTKTYIAPELLSPNPPAQPLISELTGGSGHRV